MTSEDNSKEWMTAGQATAALEVKRATLYSYVSRGLIESAPGSGRSRLYRRSDVERVRTRAEARAGHAAVAAGALRWGQPVLSTAIATITGGGPLYRGHLAVDLVAEGVSFEAVAELLWRGELDREARWSAEGPDLEAARLRAHLPSSASPMDVLALALPLLALGTPERFVTSEEAELPRGRRLVRQMVAALAALWAPERLEAVCQAPTTAAALALAFEAAPDPGLVAALERALILCADHELNVSSFTARVVASSGADLYGCIGAALAALSGPRHGGLSNRVEALLAEALTLPSPADAVYARFRRGEPVPGFGHPLYEQGDPRARLLLTEARSLAPDSAALDAMEAMAEAMTTMGQAPPSLDFGLVALGAAAGLPAGAAFAIFAIGRAAGWVAHVLEQREDSPLLIRPTARYVGPGPE